MPNLKPSAKTGLTGAAAAAVTILVFIGESTGFDIPAEVAAAAVTLVALLVAYFVPAKSGSNVDYAPDPDAGEVIEGELPGGDYAEPVKGV